MKRLLCLILCLLLTLSLCSCADEPDVTDIPDDTQPSVSEDIPALDIVFEEVVTELPENLVMTEYEGTVDEIWDEDGLTCFSVSYVYQNEQGAYIGDLVKFGMYPNEYFETDAVNPEIKVGDRVKVNSFTYNGEISQKYPSADIITVIPKIGTTFYALVLEINGNSVFAEGLEINGLNHTGLFNFSVSDETKLTYNYTDIDISRLKPGDIIAVTSVGSVLESYPSTYLDISRVSLLIPAEQVSEYEPLSNASVMSKTFTGRVNWVYTHNGRVHLGMYDDTEWYCEVILPEGYETDAAVGETVTVSVNSTAIVNDMTKYSADEVIK